ncbi:MAG: 2-phosphoglycerate kinase [Myxococcota bacterium]
MPRGPLSRFTSLETHPSPTDPSPLQPTSSRRSGAGDPAAAVRTDPPHAESPEVAEDRIDVVGRDGRWPFNQGRLLQSLYPTGLEPDQVLDVAVLIEWTLRHRGTREVTRDELRALVHGVLARDYGAEYARRYRVWRVFQNEDAKPLILLLGGTSGVGKSSLAIEVARRLSIARVLSTDAIRDVMRVMISEELVPTLHVSSFEAHQRLVTAVAPGLDPIVEGFLDQSRTVAVGVRAVIERAIVEGMNTVIDGVSLVPGLYDVGGWQERAHVVLMLAADEDPDSLRAHILTRAHGRGARTSERYLRSFAEIVRIQDALLERARTVGVEVIDVKDLEDAVRHVVSHVVSGLAASHEAQEAAVD